MHLTAEIPELAERQLKTENTKEGASTSPLDTSRATASSPSSSQAQASGLPSLVRKDARSEEKKIKNSGTESKEEEHFAMDND